MPSLLRDAYTPASTRYDSMAYRPVGTSGLLLPAVSLGMWHNFGDDTPLQKQRQIIRSAFDLGITHFDLANGYGPPMGSAEKNVGRILAEDFATLRDEIVVSTKAGYDFFPGPYGRGGGAKYLLGSLDHSLTSLRLDYVDIFYSHRFDPNTPLEETARALDTAVRSGKARYAGISSYSAERTVEMAALLRDLGTPLAIHQPSYSLLNRWVEHGVPSLLDVLDAEGIGCIAFSALAQGLLTTKYLDGIPEGSRATQGKTLRDGMLSEENLGNVAALNGIAERRGQSLAHMALAWVLRRRQVSSVLVGASRPSQVADSVAALDSPPFSDQDLADIDEYAVDGGLNIWLASSTA
ncbi:L-glyceraldehyde 3-phosphate reductase [Rhodococcus sp. BP-349]|uniref:L-glyceraldehyde 3-phosphate reductase n=1 Tax=unclassified Rhodococcus (in: high G+C Gram-positive bacteria) TaxID=192944 RepID=UPI001C9A7146|nr:MULTISPECIES: L-glyceraldehyde 3-phosphate reductase [unclassified Rhodococcus (in: high G+C Gram-positive bacteria)]MBY6539878.1 L-glyceraldehyde 3-phosphate reductase [Rhodococcus sp. BP-363]MBY6543794.1 L-glyceraldehyde 3-phosphate reductase [Rhodococcus sp. BP-369]MBY6563024.1 L-glyceraldehyde 3-phosphate reductase [Rhodococcus sp. BP-370]MBY6577316.1 L-glyceraldehyde 3-phosphate reductase [Rhodococcus sp. BP-364]MBY6586617.1 L-glyceraldehyde 3-phosphate reductase [Rhodococcus sp. BP-35